MSPGKAMSTGTDIAVYVAQSPSFPVTSTMPVRNFRIRGKDKRHLGEEK